MELPSYWKMKVKNVWLLKIVLLKKKKNVLRVWSTMIADQVVLLHVIIKMTSSIASLCVYQVGSELV